MPLRHQPGSLLPSSLRKSPRRSRKPGEEGNSFTSSYRSFFPLPSSQIEFPILMVQFFLSKLIEEIDLDTFLKEDQATLVKRGKESMAWVVGELQDYLQCECGEGEALPNNVFCDIMLQVHTCIHIFSIPQTLIRVKSSHHSMPLIFSFLLQGIRQIWIGTKLQEVGSWCQYEGWTFLYCATAGALMSYLWDMCSELFGEIEEDELVPGQFDSPPAKKLCVEAEKEETKVAEATGVVNPSGSTTKAYTDQLPFHMIWVFLLITCHTGSPSKRRGPRGVISQSLIIPACFVTTGHRTGLPPLPTPIITLMW